MSPHVLSILARSERNADPGAKQASKMSSQSIHDSQREGSHAHLGIYGFNHENSTKHLLTQQESMVSNVMSNASFGVQQKPATNLKHNKHNHFTKLIESRQNSQKSINYNYPHEKKGALMNLLAMKKNATQTQDT